MKRDRLNPWLLAGCALFLALLAIPWGGGRAGAEEPAADEPAAGDPAVGDPAAAQPAAGEPATAEPPVVIAAHGEEPPPLPRLGAMRLDAAAGRFVAPLGEGRALLTIDPGLQQKLTRVLADYRVPWGAT